MIVQLAVFYEVLDRSMAPEKYDRSVVVEYSIKSLMAFGFGEIINIFSNV